MSNIIDNTFMEHSKLSVLTLSSCYNDIEKASNLLKDIFNPDPYKNSHPITGNILYLFGNGGSSSDAQHITAEFVNKFTIDRKPLPSICLNTDTSVLTSISNDFSYDEIFSKQILALGKSDDIAFGISTSGNSSNVINALEIAKTLNMKTILLTGEKYNDKHNFDVVIKVPSKNTARIQEMHILIGHILCEIIDELYK